MIKRLNYFGYNSDSNINKIISEVIIFPIHLWCFQETDFYTCTSLMVPVFFNVILFVHNYVDVHKMSLKF